MPSQAYFPFASISGDGECHLSLQISVVVSFQSYDQLNSCRCSTALVPESFSTSTSPSEGSVSWLWKLFGGSSRKEKTAPITVPKYPANSGDINLAQALQYGTATGLPQLREFINTFAEKVYQPAYSDWTTLVHAGNTDGSVFKVYWVSGSFVFVTAAASFSSSDLLVCNCKVSCNTMLISVIFASQVV